MTRSRPITFLASAAVIPLVALAVAACGGGGAATASPPPAASKTTTAPTQTATVRVAKSSLGRILVDSTGRTLYLFKADSGTTSACSGACAIAWPPLRTGATPAAGGATAASARHHLAVGRAQQVTYNGHPLYLFVKDHKPGDVNGQGLTAFGAAWFAVSPAGNQISSHSARRGIGERLQPRPPLSRPTPPAPKPRRRPLRSRLRQPTTASPKTTVVTVTRITTAGRVTATATSR